MENQNTNNEQQNEVEITSDAVQAYLETDEGKKLLQPMLDKYHTKGLESWKKNNLQKLVDEEVGKKFPADTPEQKALKELQQELENMKREKAYESVRNKALKFSTEKQLPIEIIDLLVSHEEEATFKNLEVVESVFSSHVQKLVDAEVKKRLGESGQNIKASKDNGSAITKEIFNTMSYQDRVALLTTNPDLYKELSK